MSKPDKAPPDFQALKSEFYKFCDEMIVESKERGLISLGRSMLGSQRYLVEEVFAGLALGIHIFVILKGRQLGASTVFLALDLFWSLKHLGMQSTLVTDTEENREMFRTTITMYLESLPKAWREEIDVHNRVQLVFGKIRSRIVYQVAGTRGNKGFGAGKAIVMCHCTETGKWGPDVDIASFEASLAETNPLRLFIWESTAYGMNTFEDMYNGAKEAVTKKAIFVGWWRNELYRVERDSEVWKTYWDGSRTQEEKEWAIKVEELYGFEMADEQICWFRWKFNEACAGDMNDALEKYPWTDEQAFQMSGSNFFNLAMLTTTLKDVRNIPYQRYRFNLGMTFEETELMEANEKTVTLKVWAPVAGHAYYSIGCDPAWGSSEWADQFVIQVFRCWTEGMEQVAEFCTPDCSSVQFAWIITYLAGYYGDPTIGSTAMVNVELNGPGMATWNELTNLRRLALMAQRTEENAGIMHFLSNMENFTYRRPDSISSGMAWHTKSTNQEKERMLNALKSHYQLGRVKILSQACIREMANVIREQKSALITISAPGRKKDDRVLASALAVLAWIDLLGMRLAQARVSKASDRAKAELPPEYQQGQITVQNYLQKLQQPRARPRPHALRRA